MIPPERFDEIENDPFLKYMLKPALRFDKWIDETSLLKLNVRGLAFGQRDSDGELLEPFSTDDDLPFSHRWTEWNDKYRLANLYSWKYYYEAYPDKTPKYTLMVSSTGIHSTPRNLNKKGLSHLAFLAKFHAAQKKHKDIFRKYIKSDINLTVLEGHPSSGHVHGHTLYMLDEEPKQKELDLIGNHWNKTLGMGLSGKHWNKSLGEGNLDRSIDFELKEPKDFSEIKSLIAYPLAYIGKTSIGCVGEWSKYDVIFNTCLWLSGKHPAFGGIGVRVRAFQPSRPLSKIMNQNYLVSGEVAPSWKDPNWQFVESRLKCPNESFTLHRCENYDVNIKAWEGLGGDGGQCDTLENLRQMNEIEKGFC
jgi:hypothetical protein